MLTIWFKGIDKIASDLVGSQVALPGYFFVDSVNGSDTVGDGSPSNPWRTIIHSLNQLPSGTILPPDQFGYRGCSIKIIVASGLYQPITQNSPNKTGIEIIANIDNTVTVDTSSTSTPTVPKGAFNLDGAYSGLNFDDTGIVVRDQRRGSFRNCQVFFFQSSSIPGTMSFHKCTFISSENPLNDSNRPQISHIENKGATSEIDYISHCTFKENTSIGYGNLKNSVVIRDTSQLVIDSCDFHPSCVIYVNNLTVGLLTIQNSNWRGTIVNVEGGSTAVNLVNNIDQDPLHIGNIENRELLISPNSPLIGAGENGTTIGAFKVGQLVDLSSPEENNGVVDGNPITKSNEYSNLVTGWVTYSQIGKSPLISANGLPEFQKAPTPNFALDNENRTIIPNAQTVEVTYRESVGGAGITRAFLVGVHAYQDDLGRSTGEDDFNVYDIDLDGDLIRANNISPSNLIPFAERKINIELPDKGFGNALEGSLGTESLTQTGLSITNNNAADKVIQFVVFIDVLSDDSADWGGTVTKPITTSNILTNSKVIADIRSSSNNPSFIDILNIRTQIATDGDIVFSMFGRVNANGTNQPRRVVSASLPKKVGRYLVIGHMNLDGLSGDFNIGAINVEGFDTDEDLISKLATDRAEINELNWAGSGVYRYLDATLLRGAIADCLPFADPTEMEATLKSLFRAGAGSRLIQKTYSSAILERWKFDETSGTTANGENSLIDLTLTNYGGSPWVAAD